MTLRQETVDSLYCRLNDLKFLQVRGTPVSGKSTLASLLFYYIYNIEGESPYWISSWPDPHSPGTPPGSRKPRLSEDAEGWAWEDNSVVIFDEAQSTYWDTSLWDDVFKTLCSNPTTRRNRVIIFSSYGSPTGAMAGGTPWDVPSKNRVSFCEDRPPDGYKPVGLFFTKDEFQNYVLRRNMLQQHKFSNQLPERIFILTAGHVGAMEELFRALTAQSCYRHLTRAQTYDIADFESLDPKDLLRGLEEGSIFSRGLPKTGHLRVPETAQIFKHVLCEGGITAPTPTTPTRLPEGALGNCFQRGWLHAIPAEDNQTSYVFATHLHKWFVQWKMFGEVPGAGLSYTDLLEFTFDAFSNFSPTLLSEERNIDLGITQSTPEAQFQSEFYRCSFQLSDGHVVTFPEFGTAKGRADFYIPSEEWGIELLRDGQKLEEHVGRFSKTGKYGKTLRLSQHIILDCRFTMPRKTNSHLQNLYHVVFTLSTKPDLNPVWTIEILDNNLNAVHGMKQVLTSSNDPF
ncbi:hypothetical protein BD410DRAFT_604146 [Rickenella mellea]|uniref:Uncharacterized protein n=1 Tax=Rickenella mellea TaxID=50990 RepID=A0A4Y7QFP2_9AGAM|nr:hypothetical protein BD410DRAFT_604146 [Rickenella mellea]